MMALRIRGEIDKELDELWATITELRAASKKLETVADRVIVQIREKEGELGDGYTQKG